MTLFVFEGPSKSGKTTVLNNLAEQHPEWLRFKGENLMRKGVDENWNNYRERYHEFLHRLHDLNPENVIIADRGFTDCVYNSDEQMRKEFRRLAACYGDVHVVYFTASAEELKERGTRDEWRLEEILDRYDTLVDMFDSRVIRTDEYDEQEATLQTEKYIMNVMDEWEDNKAATPVSADD